MEAVGARIHSEAAKAAQSQAKENAEDALILQTEWVQPDPLGVLELGPDYEFEQSEGIKAAPLALADESVAEELLPASGRSILSWVVPVFAATAIAGWTAFFAYTHWSSMQSGAALSHWTGWISEWAIPVLLVGVAWLLAMRNSHAEAHRFGKTASMLAREARDLESRLSVVNRELSLAREFLGSQSRELDTLGRMATDRISTHAGALEGLIKDNSAQLDAIAAVSDTAMANMAKLRDDLPVISNSAKDVSNQVGNAGRTAQKQLDKLVVGLERLSETGAANEQRVDSFGTKVNATLDNFEKQLSRLQDAANARFAELNERSEAVRNELTKSEADALQAMRDRADHLRQDVDTMRATLAEEETKSVAAMRNQIGALRSDAEIMTAALKEKEASTLAGLSQAKERFFADMQEVINKIDTLDQQAVASATDRIKALHAEASEYDERLRVRDHQITQEIAQRQDALKASEAAAIEDLSERLAELDAKLSERAELQEKRGRKLAHQSELIATQVQDLNGLFEGIAGTASNAEQTVSASLDSFKSRVLDGEAELTRTGKAVSDLTDASMRLMELLDASSQKALEEFPKAASQASNALGPVEDRTMMLSAMMEETVARAERVSQHVKATNAEISGTDEALQNLQGLLASQSQSIVTQVDELRNSLRSLDAEGTKLTERTSKDLSGAISGLESAIQAAFSAMESGTHQKLGGLAQGIGSDAATAIETALSERLDEVLTRIEARTQNATGASKEAAEQLRAQLDEVNLLAAKLETRIADARRHASEPAGADFARRMALLTDSLNANAIDLTGALSSEVSDTAWASYMKGDRGIFTRRAVKLLDGGQARKVAALYQDDDAFRANVDRYIHDFEQMLAGMLATAEGNALSVTMLGSDIGKLYVSLAQAIERLRN